MDMFAPMRRIADDRFRHVDVPESKSSISFQELVQIVRRRWRWVAASIALSLLLAGVYLATAAPVYSASASLLIQSRMPSLVSQNGEVARDPMGDAANAESQVEAIRSSRIAKAVITDLNLLQDPEFVGTGQTGLLSSIKGAVRSLFSSAPENAESEEELHYLDALEAYQRSLTVRRVGMSYVIEVEFKSKDRQKAARLANAVANTYVRDQIEGRAQTLGDTSRWLEGRIAELRDRASAADMAVQEFKMENNIIDANGRLISDQQLSDLSTQLGMARSETSQARARLDRVEQIAKSGVTDANLAEALKNEVITKLRQQYNEAARREAEWSSRYGVNHIAAVNLRQEMKSTEKAIQDELDRIGQTYKSDYEIAKTREASLEKRLEEAFQQSSTTRNAQVKLRSLESSADSYRALHDSFLQRYMQTVQQQSSPIAEAAVIKQASPPLIKSWPKGTLVLALALGAGAGLGFGAAMARDYADKRIRTAAQGEQITGAPCLGVIPDLSKDKDFQRLIQQVSKKLSMSDVAEGAGEAVYGPIERKLGPVDPMLSYAISHPFSQFAETLRSIKVSMNGVGRRPKIIAFASCLPHEGKTTLAANFALLMAHAGAKVLLLDADLRNPRLTKALAPKAQLGLYDVLTGVCGLSDALKTHGATGLDVLPVNVSSQVAHTSDIIASDAMGRLLDDLRMVYDLVILDAPPMAPIVDVRALAHLVDDFVLVTAWGETPKGVLEKALQAAPNVRDKLIGFILNKVDVERYESFEGDAGAYYSSQHWTAYGKPEVKA